MVSLKGIIERATGRRTTQSRWDERWADPKFYSEILLDEIGHYSILSGYARELKPRGVLADIGCGAGVFRDHLHPDAFSKYVGVDFPEAIARAQPRVDEKTSFVASDLRAFTPTEKFDTIVFSEVLYYVDDVPAELDRYSAFLKPDGVFLASMHRKEGTERMFDKIIERFDMLDLVTLTNRRKTGWILGAFRPKKR